MPTTVAPEPPTDDDAFDPGRERDLAALPAFLRLGSAGAGEPDDREPASRAASSAARSRAPVPDPGPRDPAALPMVAISPRRLLQLVAAVALVWGVVSFGRQVATATAASGRERDLAAANAALQGQVDAMQEELVTIQTPPFVDQQARAYRLGTVKELPFALAPGAPTLPPDAPGSAATRIGATVDRASPLDHWLTILFGGGSPAAGS